MTQVTIGNVLRAAEIGRAPLAAESAGYLALAVADQLVRAPLAFDPAMVTLSKEGTVLVTGGRKSDVVDAERTVRALLGRLLSVSPSSTPALGAAARRVSGQGVGALVDELEGALIPVNRGAARRAIARLARETSKAEGDGLLDAVELHSFDVVVPAPQQPRAAVQAPQPRPAPAPVAAPPASRPSSKMRAKEVVVVREPEPEPPPVLHVDTMLPRVSAYEVDEPAVADEAFTDQPPTPLEVPAVIDYEGLDRTFAEPVEQSTHPLPVEVDHHTAPLPFGSPMPELPQGRGPLGIVAPPPKFAEPEVHVFEGTPLGIAPLAPNAAPVPPTHVVTAVAEPPTYVVGDIPPPSPSPPPVSVGAASALRLKTRAAATVDELLATFKPSESLEHDELRGILKRAAGLDPTPPPPGAMLYGDDPESDLPPPSAAEPRTFTMSDPPRQPDKQTSMRPTPRPRAGMGVLATLLLAGVAATIFVYARFPSFFSGHP